jgi:hypothetical protein
MRKKNFLLLSLVILAIALIWSGQRFLSASAERIKTEQSLLLEDQEKLRAITQRLEGLNKGTILAPVQQRAERQVPKRIDAELALQSQVTKLADDNNISMQSFGPFKVDSQMETVQPIVGFSFEAEAGLADLYRFMAATETAQPGLGITNLSIRPIQNIASDAEVVLVRVSISLWGFWSGPK